MGRLLVAASVASAMIPALAAAPRAASTLPESLDRHLGGLASGGRSATTEAAPEYRIGPRDHLGISVFSRDRNVHGSEPLAMVVNDSGTLSLPLIGLVTAAGKSTPDLEAELSEAYRRFVKEPQVTVVVTAYRARKVYVLGKVGQVGPIYLEHQRTRLLEVLSRAGGVEGSGTLLGGDPRNIVVVRGARRIRVDLLASLMDGESVEHFYVEDGDYIFVPQPQGRVRVLGGVQEASELILTPGLTLLQAIAQSGSFTPNSRRERVRILRQGGRESTTLRVDATRIFHGHEPDVPLEAGDVIYVGEW